MELSCPLTINRTHDSNSIVDDWAKLAEFIVEQPDPEQDALHMATPLRLLRVLVLSPIH
jgi:hypothetical protein